MRIEYSNIDYQAGNTVLTRVKLLKTEFELLIKKKRKQANKIAVNIFVRIRSLLCLLSRCLIIIIIVYRFLSPCTVISNLILFHSFLRFL